MMLFGVLRMAKKMFHAVHIGMHLDSIIINRVLSWGDGFRVSCSLILCLTMVVMKQSSWLLSSYLTF